MPANNEEVASESRVQGVLFKNINLVMAVLAPAFIVFLYFNNPITEMRQELAVTKQELFTTKERLAKVEVAQENTTEKINEMSDKITRILTILEGKAVAK